MEYHMIHDGLMMDNSDDSWCFNDGLMLVHDG